MMSLKRILLDLLFPPRCPFCDALLDKEWRKPCPKCEKADFWLQSDQAIVSGTAFARCACVGWYADKLRDSVRRFKFSNCPDYAKAYGPLLAKTVRFYLPGMYDLVTWVPVSPDTLKSRGYDQARLLAEETAAALGTTAVPLLAKTGKNVPQSSLSDGRQRWRNVAGVYSVPDPGQVAGQRVLVIDDILTTGATLEEAAKTLRRAGATQVVAATFCRTPPRKND